MSKKNKLTKKGISPRKLSRMARRLANTSGVSKQDKRYAFLAVKRKASGGANWIDHDPKRPIV